MKLWQNGEALDGTGHAAPHVVSGEVAMSARNPLRWMCHVVFLLAVVCLVFSAAGYSVEAQAAEEQSNQALVLQDGLSAPYAAPQFSGIAAWLNSPPLTMDELKGKVVLIDFWTYSCINCVRTLPYLTDWYRKYHDKGLVIVGVHSPEFDFEKRIGNVRAAIARYGIRYPVAMDNDMATWGNYHNRFWPAHYLIDRDGRVVYIHFGEGKYDVTEHNIRYLLGLTGTAQTIKAEVPTFMPNETPETYLGYARAERFGGHEVVRVNTEATYHFPVQLSGDEWALGGKWTVAAEKIVSGGKGAALRLHFSARKVFLVLGTVNGKAIKVRLKLNGKAVDGSAGKDAPGGVVTVDHNTLYELIDQKAPRSGLIEIETDAPGLEAYAFTFG